MESLKSKIALRTTDKIGIVFNPGDELFFKNLYKELGGILGEHLVTTGVHFELIEDAYTSKWIIFDHRDFGKLVNATIHAGNSFMARGFGKRLLAIAVPFRYENRKAYWIYNYKRERIYPFIPTGPKTRDGKAETKLEDVMRSEGVVLEKRLELWYPLWGIPF